MLGTRLGPAALTIHANRSAPVGAATVKWDDEGVAPDEFTLVREGIITDYITAREHVGMMTPWYTAQRRPARSHGCAAAAHGMAVPLAQTPNLVMQPSSSDADFNDLVSGVSDGLAIMGGFVWFDFQQLNARGRPERAYRIKNGQLAGPVRDIAYLIRGPELWKDLVAVGGPRSAAWRGMTVEKGQPSQETVHGVCAVPAHIRNVRVISAEAPVLIT
jgi:TldD protein